MSKQSEWTKAVTEDMRRNMLVSAEAAYNNGCTLKEDAILLLNAGRYPRAVALAILSEEEFSKAFILRICAGQGRWDSNIHSALRKHSNKQGISEAMREHIDWFINNWRRVMEMNRYAFIPMQPALTPGPEKMAEIIDKAKKTFAKPLRDYLKQDAFYVSVDENAKMKSTPLSITIQQAEQCLAEASKLKAVVEALVGDASGLTRHTAL